MPDDFLRIDVKGLDKLLAGFKRFPQEIRNVFEDAGKKSAEMILKERGLRQYPPETKANLPPTPYYVRTKGTQYKSYLKMTSENLGKKWYVKPAGLGVKIGNPASYAKWVHGDEQANAMAKIGWKKLDEVAKGKTPRIKKIYQDAINYLIRKLGL